MSINTWFVLVERNLKICLDFLLIYSYNTRHIVRPRGRCVPVCLIV